MVITFKKKSSLHSYYRNCCAPKKKKKPPKTGQSLLFLLAFKLWCRRCSYLTPARWSVKAVSPRLPYCTRLLQTQHRASPGKSTLRNRVPTRSLNTSPLNFTSCTTITHSHRHRLAQEASSYLSFLFTILPVVAITQRRNGSWGNFRAQNSLLLACANRCMYGVASQRKILGIFFSAEFLFSGPFYFGGGGGQFFFQRKSVDPRPIPMPDIEGFQPEWCISTIYHALDKPFWSGTLDIYQAD